MVRLHGRQSAPSAAAALMTSTRMSWRGDRLAQRVSSVSNRLKASRLVLVQRIALAVAAKPDDLAQMFEHHEMLAPQMVDRLQEDRLLDIAHDVGAVFRDLGGHVLVGRARDALAHFFLGDAFFLHPRRRSAAAR